MEIPLSSKLATQPRGIKEMFMSLDIYDVSFLGVKFLFAGLGPTISFGLQMSNNWPSRKRSMESRGAKALHIIKSRGVGSSWQSEDNRVEKRFGEDRIKWKHRAIIYICRRNWNWKNMKNKVLEDCCWCFRICFPLLKKFIDICSLYLVLGFTETISLKYITYFAHVTSPCPQFLLLPYQFHSISQFPFWFHCVYRHGFM